MKAFGSTLFLATVADSSIETQRVDACTALCDEFVEGGLCGDFESHCMSNGNCWELFWTEQGRTMISGIFPNARRDRPVSCEDARLVMDARERSSGPPPSPRRHPTRITSPIPGVRGLTMGDSAIMSAIQVLSHLRPFKRLLSDHPSSSDDRTCDRWILANAISEAIREMWSGSSINAINIQDITNFVARGSDLLGVLIQITTRLRGLIDLREIYEITIGRSRRCVECRETVEETGYSGRESLFISLRRGESRLSMENSSLRDAMAIYFQNEYWLEFFGQSCVNCRRPSSRRIEVNSFIVDGPNVLIYYLPRAYGRRDIPNDTNVEFPLEMNLEDMPGNGQGRYRLVAIVNTAAGHEYVEILIDDHWYLFDNEVVYDLGNQPLGTNSRRITHLFYEKIDYEATVSTTNTGSIVPSESTTN